MTVFTGNIPPEDLLKQMNHFLDL